MLTITAWKRAGEERAISGRTWKDLEGQADAFGAVMLKDYFGQILIKISGEWVVVPKGEEKKKGKVAP